MKRRLPDIRLKILSNGDCYLPEDVRETASLVPLSFFDTLRNLADSKVLIFAGGTHISDEGNIPLRRIRAHLAILFLTIWAKFLGAKIAHVSIGLGPLSNGLTKLIAAASIRLADFVSVRDQNSATRAIELSPRCDVLTSMDASLLCVSNDERHLDSDCPTVGVSVLPYMDIYKINGGCDDSWLGPLAQALGKLACRHERLRFRLFEFSGNERYGDLKISERLSEKMGLPDRVSIVPYNGNPENATREISCCSYFVGMRYHSILFSVSNHVPTIVLPYAEKCVDLARDFGLEESVIDKDKMTDSDYLESRLEDLINNPSRYTSTLGRKAQKELSQEGIPSHKILREWTRE